MATKKKPRQKKGRQALIDQVERKLLGESEPEKKQVEKAVLGQCPPDLKHEKDGSLTCPVHSSSHREYRRKRPGSMLFKAQGGKTVIWRTSAIIYVNDQPFCSRCWEIVEHKRSGTGVWKFIRKKYSDNTRAFLMHRTRPARVQELKEVECDD